MTRSCRPHAIKARGRNFFCATRRHVAFLSLIPGRSPARRARRITMLRLNRPILPFLIQEISTPRCRVSMIRAWHDCLIVYEGVHRMNRRPAPVWTMGLSSRTEIG